MALIDTPYFAHMYYIANTALVLAALGQKHSNPYANFSLFLAFSLLHLCFSPILGQKQQKIFFHVFYYLNNCIVKTLRETLHATYNELDRSPIYF